MSTRVASAIGVTGLVVLVAGLVLGFPVDAPAPPIAAVVVTNTASQPVPVAAPTPLPVSGSVMASQSGPWVVDLNGVPTVIAQIPLGTLLGIDPGNNVVRNHDEPARQPVQAFTVNTVGSTFCIPYGVPAGKRLVVEMAAALLTASGLFPGVQYAAVNGFPLTGLVPDDSGTTYLVSQQTRLYLDGGDFVRFAVFGFQNGFVEHCWISGYLVDVG